MGRIIAFYLASSSVLALAQSGTELAPPRPHPQQPAQAVPAQPVEPPEEAPEPEPATGVAVQGQGTVWNAQPAPQTAPATPDGYGNGAPVYQQPQPPGPVYQQPYSPQLAYATRARRVRIRYEPGMEVPEGATIIEVRKRGLLIAGAAVFAGSYGISAVAASFGGDAAIFAVPIVGPIIWQARDGVSDTLAGAVLLSLAQIAGITLFSIGLRKRSYVEYWTASVGGRQLAVLPSFSHEHFGLSLSLL